MRRHCSVASNGAVLLERSEEGELIGAEVGSGTPDRDIAAIGLANIAGQAVVHHVGDEPESDDGHHAYRHAEDGQQRALTVARQRERGVRPVYAGFHLNRGAETLPSGGGGSAAPPSTHGCSYGR